MATMSTSLTRPEALSLLSLSAASLAILFSTFQDDTDGQPLMASLALSILAFSLCFCMIRWLGPNFVRAGFAGHDLSKAHRPLLPECMGAVCAAVYLLTVIVFIPFPFYKDIVAATSGGGNRDVVMHVEHVNNGRFLHRFPHSKVSLVPPLPPGLKPVRRSRSSLKLTTSPPARIIPQRHHLPPDYCPARNRR